MAFYIRMEKEEDIEWMSQLIVKMFDRFKTNHPYDLNVIDIVARWSDAIAQYRSTEDAADLEIPAEATKDDKPSRKGKRGGGKKGDSYTPNLCPTHPNKALKRAPRDGCEGCWDGYKRMHPLEYDQARRKYDRKQLELRASS